MRKELFSLCLESYRTAVYFRQLGFRVFPCSISKHPIVKGWKAIAINPATYGNQKKNPTCLWGIHCNQGFFVIDVDCYSEQFKLSAKAQAIYKKLKNYKIKQYTQSGGEHFFFQGTYENSASKIAPGIDSKSHGGYIILYQNPALMFNDIESMNDLIKKFPKIKTKKKEQKKQTEEIKKISPKNVDTTPLRTQLEKQFKRPIFVKGSRNNDLFIMAMHMLKQGEAGRLDVLHQLAIDSGLSFEEVQKTIGSAQRTYIEDRQGLIDLITVDKNEELKLPVAFGNLFLHNSFNLLSGPTKTGKSRAVMTYIATELQKNEYQGKKGLIVSSENPIEQMQKPYLMALDALEFVRIGDPKSLDCYHEKLKGKTGQKEYIIHTETHIENFLQKIEDEIIHRKWEVVFLDPLPRFLDWNKEKFVIRIFEKLQAVADKYKCCIIGVRNDGKKIDYSEEHKVKGSSGAADAVRMGVRCLPADPKSFFGKKFAPNKCLILTNHYLNSLLKNRAELYSLNVIQYKKTDIALAQCEKVFLDNNEIHRLKYYCSAPSGYTMPALIITILKQRQCTRADIIKELPLQNPKSIYKSIQRLLEKKQIKEIKIEDEETQIETNLLSINKK